MRGRVGGAPPDRRPPGEPRGRRRPRPDAGRAARPAVGRRDPGIDRLDGPRDRSPRLGRRARRARRELHLVVRPRQRRVARLHGRGEPRDEGDPLRVDRRGPRVRMAGVDRLGHVRDLGGRRRWCGPARSRRRNARDVDGGRAHARAGPRGRDPGGARVRAGLSGARTCGARHAGEDRPSRRHAPGAPLLSAVTQRATGGGRQPSAGAGTPRRRSARGGVDPRGVRAVRAVLRGILPPAGAERRGDRGEGRLRYGVPPPRCRRRGEGRDLRASPSGELGRRGTLDEGDRPSGAGRSPRS